MDCRIISRWCQASTAGSSRSDVYHVCLTVLTITRSTTTSVVVVEKGVMSGTEHSDCFGAKDTKTPRHSASGITGQAPSS
jgi:hypothetical protein